MEEWTDRVISKIKDKYEWFEPEKTMIENLERYPSILEIGSGLGRYTALIPRVVGLEYSSHFISYCQKNVEGIFLRADGFNIPIKNNVFDCVFSSGVIEHFDNPEDLINEHIRVCKTGGIVIITAPARFSLDYQRIKLSQKYLAKGKIADWHYFGRRIGDKELYELLKGAELNNIEIFHLGSPLRGNLLSLLAYLKMFPSKPSTDLLKGITFEGLGHIISNKVFRAITRDTVFKKYMKTHGYYLFSKSKKVVGLENQNSEIRIRKYEDLFKVLICPQCRNSIYRKGDFLLCDSCEVSYPLKENVPFLTLEDAIKK